MIYYYTNYVYLQMMSGSVLSPDNNRPERYAVVPMTGCEQEEEDTISGERVTVFWVVSYCVLFS